MVNKRKAADDVGQAQSLKESGYRFPVHWGHRGERPFVGWDGEGITYPGDVQQSYVLFGASTGDRLSKPSLGSTDCFDLLLAVERTNPDAIHVGFAVQYDCNMMFKDLGERHLWYLYRHNRVKWNGYRIEYRPGKWLNITKDGTTVRLFDVWGFFQSSFVTACEKFLGKDDPELVRIREGKRARSSFTWDQLEPFIVPYWEGELRLLVRLMDSLRDDLLEAGLPIKSWHGPGAVANQVFRQFNVGPCKGEVPPQVGRAAQFAYAGGRFELFKAGHHAGPVYQYDINSAYPSAIADLPDLSGNRWEKVSVFEPDSFGVWYIRRDATGNPYHLFSDPQPLFVRDEHGNVSYPPIAEGWYWTPEAALVADCVLGGWVLRHDGAKPFGFVNDMYERRAQWKSEGRSAEKALKLALNSLYGKMAQRAGWTPDNRLIPRWHQLEWAGFVTSTTRAKLWNVMRQMSISGSVIASETDAVFTTRLVPESHITVGKALGSWDLTTYDWITYLQNGMYFAGQDGTIIEKYRGFDRGCLNHEQVLDYLDSLDRRQPHILFGDTTRFVGLGVGLYTKAAWRSWQTQKRAVRFGGGGKRSHIPNLCPQCQTGAPLNGTLHTLTVVTPGGRSQPHSLPWLADAESELRRLDELERW